MTSGVEPITYLWSWGDGTYDSIAYPHHTYDTAGYYTICLFIHDSAGCSDTLCHSYELQKPSSPNEIITVNVIPNIPSALQNINILKAWSVFPNPAHNTISINYTLSTASKVVISLYNVLGNRMHYETNAEQSGEQNKLIDISKLSNGIYVLQIQTGDQVVSRKIAVMN
jgi:PKD repeat protein